MIVGAAATVAFSVPASAQAGSQNPEVKSIVVTGPGSTALKFEDGDISYKDFRKGWVSFSSDRTGTDIPEYAQTVMLSTAANYTLGDSYNLKSVAEALGVGQYVSESDGSPSIEQIFSEMDMRVAEIENSFGIGIMNSSAYAAMKEQMIDVSHLASFKYAWAVKAALSIHESGVLGTSSSVSKEEAVQAVVADILELSGDRYVDDKNYAKLDKGLFFNLLGDEEAARNMILNAAADIRSKFGSGVDIGDMLIGESKNFKKSTFDAAGTVAEKWDSSDYPETSGQAVTTALMQAPIVVTKTDDTQMMYDKSGRFAAAVKEGVVLSYDAETVKHINSNSDLARKLNESGLPNFPRGGVTWIGGRFTGSRG